MNVPNQTYDPSCGRSVSAVNWFADHGYPHRSGTRVRPLVMGEEAFAAVARELKGAQKSINMAFWGLDPGMVLIRGTYSNYDARDALGSILIERAKAGVEVKVCVWDQLFSGIGSGGSGTDEILKQPNSRNLAALHAAARLFPSLKVQMVNAHSALGSAGSYHQKFIVIDGEDSVNATAFIMGHNMMPNYWDQKSLLASNPKRNFYLEISGTSANGFTYTAHPTTALGPFIDVSTQIWGDGVKDTYHAFERIWKLSGLTGLMGGQVRPTYDSIRANDYGSRVRGRAPRSQVAATFSMYSEQSVRQQYLKAISNGDKYVFILNQYLRDQRLTRQIISAFEDRCIPEHRQPTIIIISNDWETNTSGFEFQANKGHDTLVLKRFADAGIKVYYAKLNTNRAANRVSIYIHSKVLIVDDVFYTIGSTNYNDRSMVSDPELNIGVMEPSIARELRRELLNLVAGTPVEQLVTDPENSDTIWGELLRLNDSAAGDYPNGSVVPFAPERWRGIPSYLANINPEVSGGPVPV